MLLVRSSSLCGPPQASAREGSTPGGGSRGGAGVTTDFPTLTRHPSATIFTPLEGRLKAETAVAEPFEPDPGHAGEGTRLADAHPPFVARTRAKRRTAMNEHAKIKVPSG